ncbi:hypothetical protein [Sinorhizobium fredii]|uniref:hypothetical protein n=1 Tax=Rhizobium fredii TaxID=380 RepID=UPI0012FD4161|nr:hypothetical protein [Sinorhizobium fredii]
MKTDLTERLDQKAAARRCANINRANLTALRAACCDHETYVATLSRLVKRYYDELALRNANWVPESTALTF